MEKHHINNKIGDNKMGDDIEPTNEELDAIEAEGVVNEDSVQTIKVFGIYALTVDWSVLNKGSNDEPLFLYCVTNTETGVREWEDTLAATAVSYCRDLNTAWEKEFKEEPKISVPELLLPKSVQ